MCLLRKLNRNVKTQQCVMREIISKLSAAACGGFFQFCHQENNVTALVSVYLTRTT